MNPKPLSLEPGPSVRQENRGPWARPRFRPHQSPGVNFLPCCENNDAPCRVKAQRIVDIWWLVGDTPLRTRCQTTSLRSSCLQEQPYARAERQPYNGMHFEGVAGVAAASTQIYHKFRCLILKGKHGSPDKIGGRGRGCKLRGFLLH